MLGGENRGSWEEPRAVCTRTRLAGLVRAPGRSQAPGGKGQAGEEVSTAGSAAADWGASRLLCISPHLLPQWGR